MPLTQLTATLLIDVSDRADFCLVAIGSRIILEQNERNSAPTLGVGVTIHSGSFRGISGPGSCPTFGRNSVVLEVRDVDRADALAEGLVGTDSQKPLMTEEWAAAVDHRHQRRAADQLA